MLGSPSTSAGEGFARALDAQDLGEGRWFWFLYKVLTV